MATGRRLGEFRNVLIKPDEHVEGGAVTEEGMKQTKQQAQSFRESLLTMVCVLV